MAVFFRNTSAPPGHARPQAQHSHGETQTTPASWSFSPPPPDTDLFMAMFLIRLPPSMREAVGAGNHKTAADMVRAADALWDARGGHDPIPMVAAATTHRSRSPAPTGGKTSNKRNGNACSKSPPSRPAFHAFQNPANGVCKFHNYHSNRAHRCVAPCTLSEN